jgi:hypothetical protein
MNPCRNSTVCEIGRPFKHVVEAWSAVWSSFWQSEDFAKRHTPALCLLLSNPLEVVELACEDHKLVSELRELLGLPCGTDGDAFQLAEHWTRLGFREDTSTAEAIKWLKAPSWRYRTEVLGLAKIAVHKITNGEFASIDKVCCVWSWS